MHVLNESGQDFTLHIERAVPEGPPSENPRTGPRSYARYWTVRILDPKEETIFQREYADADSTALKQQHVVPGRGRGVYQVLINAGMGGTARIWTEPALPVAADSRCYPWYLDDDVRDAYFYVPRHTTRVLLDLMPLGGARNRAVIVYDDEGRQRARVGGTEPHNMVTLEPERTDVVWRLALEGSGPFNFHLDHVPALLTPDADTARKIRGSVIEVGDTILHHEFQRELWDIIHEFEPSDFDVAPQTLDPDSMMKTPRISAISLGQYGPLSVLPHVVQHQNTDPKSHWFGSIHDWESWSKQPAPRNRWDRDYPGPHVIGRGLHANMAWAYAKKFPGNPYQGDQGLLNRTVIALAIQLMRMTEEDIFNEFEYENWKRCWLHYHFDYPEGGTQAFHYIADDLPEATRRAIEKGLRRQAELLRYYHSGCTNQWAIMLHGHWQMYETTGDENYRDLVTRHLASLVGDDVGENPQSDWYHVGQAPAGYYREYKGFDGAYNSVSAFGIGALYLETKRPELLESLRRSFRLRNHLTLVDGDGNIVSPTNMNHRTSPMACKPFYPDAALCAQFLPEAATWLHRYRTSDVHSMAINVWRPDHCEATV
ncbi:MAG: hypothetical protein CMJ18_10865, partial [Phycisphaeraceae bacterium]|nr:hypothetical protein [Phycisphaeraceae bacterium]